MHYNAMTDADFEAAPATRWVARCTDCEQGFDVRRTHGTAASDADWHNTMTGHRVNVVDPDLDN